MPLEAEISEPRVIWVRKRHFHDDLRWEFKPFRFLAWHLDHKRKKIKRGAFPSLPAKFEECIGETDLRWIANDGLIFLYIARIANELWVPNANPQLARSRRGKDGDHRPEFAPIGRKLNMLKTGFKDAFGGGEMSHVAYIQVPPLESPGAAYTVAPGKTRPQFQFFVAMRIGAPLLDL
jgi:hypothetical protein